MARTFEADGERWEVGIDDQAAHPGMRALVFHCVSAAPRPYRVAEVPISAGELDMSDRALREYFESAHTLDYSSDPASEPHRHGSIG
ncbi:MAG TPA: hypothetical protein VK939_07145 [Longimicrobiales bacterium]|nr:hypothetical protein [Longimicrobiales bacterium]